MKLDIESLARRLTLACGVLALAACGGGGDPDNNAQNLNVLYGKMLRIDPRSDAFPADALRERTFEIFVHLVVSNKAARDGATHALRVMVDGALEWQRSVPTHADGDALDLRLRRVVPAGRPLRLNATCALKGSQRVSLSITADEE